MVARGRASAGNARSTVRFVAATKLACSQPRKSGDLDARQPDYRPPIVVAAAVSWRYGVDYHCSSWCLRLLYHGHTTRRIFPQIVLRIYPIAQLPTPILPGLPCWKGSPASAFSREIFSPPSGSRLHSTVSNCARQCQQLLVTYGGRLNPRSPSSSASRSGISSCPETWSP